MFYGQVRTSKPREIRAVWVSGLGIRRTKRSEGWSGIQMRGKIVDEGIHIRMSKSVEAKEIHFFYSLFRGPFFKSHAVSGDKHAGAVIAEAAMHKYFLLRIIAEEGEKLCDLLIARRSPTAHGDVNGWAPPSDEQVAQF